MKSKLLLLMLTVLIAQSAWATEPKGVQVLKHSWKAGDLTWESLGKAQFEWNAIVKNEAAESRKICVNYELLGQDDAVLSSSSRCQVVPAGGEGEIFGAVFVDAKVLADAKNSRATATESHILYYPATPKPAAN
jgi:hypothetical protein